MRRSQRIAFVVGLLLLMMPVSLGILAFVSEMIGDIRQGDFALLGVVVWSVLIVGLLAYALGGKAS